jgi:hypothetical protein
MSPRSIALRRDAPKCTTIHDFGGSRLISRLCTPVDSRELLRTSVEAGVGNRVVTAIGSGNNTDVRRSC